MTSGVAFNFKKKRVIIKISERTETKQVLLILKKKLPEMVDLYEGVQPAVLIIGKDFSEKEQANIQKLFDKFFNVEIEFDSTKMLGLHGIRKPFNKEIATSKTMFCRKSLRSGQKAEFAGSIVVLGDVNYGAEVIAGGNIIVLGCIRGMVHAGAKGNKEAIIAAECIEATQIRISNIVRESDRDEFTNDIIKTNAYVDDNDQIVIE